MTSFDVVAIVRKKLGIKKVGHLGTLDPMATGVLPIAIGNAPRVMEYLDCESKRYSAQVKLGIATDTDDIWGTVTESGSREALAELSEPKVREALSKFEGVIDQVPPKYAALKVDGKKLYQYAREGTEVEINSRKVYIPCIELKGLEVDVAAIDVTCSKGTYIRSIARDLGELLGAKVTLCSLIRTQVGPYNISESITPEDVKEMSAQEVEVKILPVDTALGRFSSARVEGRARELFINGVRLRENQWDLESEAAAETYPLDVPEKYSALTRVYDAESVFLGMGIRFPNNTLKADKVFAER